MTESDRMTDWAEMPAPSPEMVAAWTRFSEARRAKRIETARDAYVMGAMGVRPADMEPLGRHDALLRLEASYAVRWALRMTYPAVMGRPR